MRIQLFVFALVLFSVAAVCNIVVSFERTEKPLSTGVEEYARPVHDVTE